MTKFAVIADNFDPKYNSIWGPFNTQAEAKAWIDTNWVAVNASPTPDWLIEALQDYRPCAPHSNTL